MKHKRIKVFFGSEVFGCIASVILSLFIGALMAVAIMGDSEAACVKQYETKAERIKWFYEEGEESVKIHKREVEKQQPKTLYWSLGEFQLTAYCACEKCCGAYANGYTATGTLATAGRTIAVDPNVIPYGTKVIINGHEYVAEDCGGGIKSNRIDIFFDSHQEALNFGVQKAEVFIYD